MKKMKEMELKDYKLFIYDDVNFNMDNSSIRSEYWKQLESEDEWYPISFTLFNIIYDYGWLNDLVELDFDISPEYFVMKKLKITERHEICLKRLDDFISNYFINFETELKEKQDNPIKKFLYTDFENGEVFIIKYLK